MCSATMMMLLPSLFPRYRFVVGCSDDIVVDDKGDDISLTMMLAMANLLIFVDGGVSPTGSVFAFDCGYGFGG